MKNLIIIGHPNKQSFCYNGILKTIQSTLTSNKEEVYVIDLYRENLTFQFSKEQVVGINYNDFKKYLESKFFDGMSWENRGEWHIDHIIPLSAAKTEQELISLCHYSNLQPLWGEDNIKKGNKI